MRILWVKAGKLLPVDTGGRLRSYHLLKQLSGRDELVMLSYYDGDADPAYEAALSRELPGAVAMPSGLGLGGSLSRVAHYVSCLPSPAPYAVRKFSTPAVVARVSEMMSGGDFDVAVCDFLSASLNVPSHSPTPVVLFQHNVETVLWERQAARERNWIKRAFFGMEAAKMRRYERDAVRRFRHIVAVSEHDAAYFLTQAPGARVAVVPTGVDTNAFRRPVDAPPVHDNEVLFLGSMDWMPNIDAVEWFAGEIWPRVLAREPGARFRIVGRSPDARVRRLASESIEVTGTVPAVQDALHRGAVFVVPLRVGGGTRLKIFEAMAAGKAVVSTRIGAEGLDVSDGVDCLLRDDAESFSDAVVALLHDGARRVRLERAAFDLALRHDWSKVALAFEAVLRQAAGTGRARAAAPANVV